MERVRALEIIDPSLLNNDNKTAESIMSDQKE